MVDKNLDGEFNNLYNIKISYIIINLLICSRNCGKKKQIIFKSINFKKLLIKFQTSLNTLGEKLHLS